MNLSGESCFDCKHFLLNKRGMYCKKSDIPLKTEEICNDYEYKNEIDFFGFLLILAILIKIILQGG